MKKPTIAIFLLTFLLSTGGLAEATPPSLSMAIDRFFATVYENAHYYHWEVNDSTFPTQHEMVLDVKTVFTKKAGDTPDENRFLLLIVEGKVFAAHHIPVGSKVDCADEEEV